MGNEKLHKGRRLINFRILLAAPNSGTLGYSKTYPPPGTSLSGLMPGSRQEETE